MGRLLRGSLVLAALLLCAALPDDEYGSIKSPSVPKPPPKIDSALHLIQRIRNGGPGDRAQSAYGLYVSQGRSHIIRTVDEDHVIIDAVATNDTAALLADLEEVGMKGGGAYHRWVSGWLPIRAIPNLGQLSSLHHASPAAVATQAGMKRMDILVERDIKRRLLQRQEEGEGGEKDEGAMSGFDQDKVASDAIEKKIQLGLRSPPAAFRPPAEDIIPPPFQDIVPPFAGQEPFIPFPGSPNVSPKHKQGKGKGKKHKKGKSGKQGKKGGGAMGGNGKNKKWKDKQHRFKEHSWTKGTMVKEGERGSIVSEADAAMGTDQVRATYNIAGEGMTIGILSDSFDKASGLRTDADQDIEDGNLPDMGQIKILKEGPSGSDEGRAMMQLIHDIVPRVDYLFHTAFAGLADFAAGIDKLADKEVDVMTDDVIYFREPMFMDGPIAQAVDDAYRRGIPYFSSAGNNGRQGYSSELRLSDKKGVNGGIAHDFDPGSDVADRQKVTIPVGSRMLLVMQWDEPYYSVTGDEGSQSDLDVYLLDAKGNAVSYGGNSNNIDGDPIDMFEYFNDGYVDEDDDDGADETFYLQIVKDSGSTPTRVKYVMFGSSSVKIEEFAGEYTGTLYGHANSHGAMAVGAAFYANTPYYIKKMRGTRGEDDDDDNAKKKLAVKPETFSSAGPQAIWFDNDGKRLQTPVLRQKPQVTAPDGSNTSFFIPGVDPEDDGYFNFYGTSAAAPNVAAVAVLMKQVNKSLKPSQLYNILMETASDIDDPEHEEQQKGFDYSTGAGLIDAPAAFKALKTRSEYEMSASFGGENPAEYCRQMNGIFDLDSDACCHRDCGSCGNEDDGDVKCEARPLGVDCCIDTAKDMDDDCIKAAGPPCIFP
ncbi:unnamed protein product [Vitrella brassicaformis CCMP3155]|uniref:subtilisin n=1 Tax=Vitrella brassicaformis (strain CCMP3155) TaxID=1169540 RepID=A0A0G4GJN2_VITBC|nr:unnamed protein product [Vitrella brassicaformis CCMP3155]|mmetsp:Transcript_48712/g.121952  ORF Transcript_48712/g.121952 Transcript_48712/m.121952 type:complete len:873 (-) Transcript_48712:737-3355(-)|eukprot:CEM30124.1 unnamed protein product [Vitrella brassicaformis CCMP3155]